jgi:5-(carboxyamino)imidazole ribonucleotide synthase
VSLLQALEAEGKLVRPSSRVLAIAQSRQAEKRFARSLGAHPVPWLPILSEADFAHEGTRGTFGEGILKTDRLGYDGKGQREVNDTASLESAFAAHKGVPCVLEKRIPLAQEISVLVARNVRGHVEVSPAVQNVHREGILRETTWFEGIAGTYEQEAQRIAIQAAHELELEGILAIEFFVSRDGKLYFNEMAPRPHNSFHGSIEAGMTSQFTQHVLSICGLPLGRLGFHTEFEMFNLIGGTWEDDWRECLCEENAHLHLYGKAESRPGRKMGHVTILR